MAGEDPEGKLWVDGRGPRWIGRRRIDLGFSHTRGVRVVVFSELSRLGVDAESIDRVASLDVRNIAKRFFHPHETKGPSRLSGDSVRSQFVELRTQKEAYAKPSTLGLERTLQLETNRL